MQCGRCNNDSDFRKYLWIKKCKKFRLAHTTQKQRKLTKLVTIFKRFGISKNQIDNFLDFFKMIRRRGDYKCVKVQIVLKIISAKPTVSIQKHFEKTMNSVYRVKGILTVSKTFRIL